jgi:beta-galactosidase GanA
MEKFSFFSQFPKKRLTDKEKRLFNVTMVIIEVPESCEIAVREKDGKKFLFVLNYAKTLVSITVKKETADLFTGRTLSGNSEIEPYGVKVLAL